MKQSFLEKLRILLPLLFVSDVYSIVVFKNDSPPLKGDSIQVGDMKAIFKPLKDS